MKAMGIKAISKSITKFVNKNAPQILAGLGIALGLGAVGMTAKGTVDAVNKVKQLEEEKGEKLEKKEIAKAVWKDYIPAAGLTIASVGCIVGSVHISARRIATLGLAYAMSDKNFKEYKEKAKEIVGVKKEEEIRGAVEQDRINANPPVDGTIIKTHGGNMLCRDKFTGQYFYSDADTIKRDINTINNLLIHDYTVSLNDVNSELGIKESKLGDRFGWNVNDGDLIVPEFTTELTPEDNPVLVLDYLVGPRPKYHNIECDTLDRFQ